jgi:mRNA-degrading endonuclease RelE of RelBE toxin-antitoxin system
MQFGAIMRILFTEQFRKQFSKLPASIGVAFRKKLQIMLDTYPDCPSGLRVKKLKNIKFNQHSFRVNIDYRVIFVLHDGVLELLEILKHNDFDKKYG